CRAFLPAVYRLVTLLVGEVLLDVGRRRHLSDSSNLLQRVGGAIQMDDGGASALLLDRSAQHRIVEANPRAGGQAAAGTGQRFPAIAFPVQRPEQEHLGLSPIIAAAEEARRENSAVIQHQQIAGLEEPWQLANGAVDQPIRDGIEYEHPGGVALSRRMLRDPLARQVVIEVSGLHAVEPSPGRLALRSGSTPC